MDPRHPRQNFDHATLAIFLTHAKSFTDPRHPRHPRQILTHTTHEPMHPRYPRHPRYLADSFVL